jgi:Na+-driven multidrug efflux pump
MLALLLWALPLAQALRPLPLSLSPAPVLQSPLSGPGGLCGGRGWARISPFPHVQPSGTRLHTSIGSDPIHAASSLSSPSYEVQAAPGASPIPEYKELLKFAMPTLGIWLLQPILSLIDTTVVGLSGTTTIAELAALGPGIGWVDSTSYLFNFMGVAMTTLFSTALRDRDELRSKQVLSNGITLSLVFGIFLLILQYTLAPWAVGVLAGSSRLSVPFAVQYARIRSFAAPAALFTIVAQAAFLASKDSITPLYAVIVGGIVNVLGDLFLVTMRGGGLAGAAWATALSQYAGAIFLFFTALSTQYKKMKGQKMVWPSLSQCKQFLEFCGPVFFVLLMKSFLWTFSTFAVGTAGAIDLAAHQVKYIMT